MTGNVFSTILNLSLNGSIAILIILLLRLLLKKAPKIFSYSLWSIALIRLICPFSFESVISLFPAKPNPIPVYGEGQTSQFTSGINFVDNAVANSIPQANISDSIDPMQTVSFIAQIIWITGILFILVYSLISFMNITFKIKDKVHIKDNIYKSQNIKTPFVFGLIKPKIILPDGLDENEEKYILLHEKNHIRRFDYIIKFISFIVLCLHWFNPLVWIAFVLCEKDMEMSCDEYVIKKLGNHIKKDYSSSLLSLSTGHRFVSATPLAFGESNPKSRIKNILNYKKPALWVIIVCIAAIVISAVCLISNPKDNQTTINTKLDLSDIKTLNIGSEMPQIIYADKDRAILQGSFGMIAYDFTTSSVTDRISYDDTRDISPNNMQINVSQDGKIAYISFIDISNGKYDDEYIELNLNNHKTKESKGKLPDNLYEPIGVSVDISSDSEYAQFISQNYLYGYNYQYNDNSDIIFTRAETNWMVKSLEIVKYNLTTNEYKIYPVFDNHLIGSDTTEVLAEIIGLDYDNTTLLVKGLDYNSIIGNRCNLDCKKAEIKFGGETEIFSELQIGNIISFPCKTVNEIYPTMTDTDRITVLDKVSIIPVLYFNTDTINSNDTIENVSAVGTGEYFKSRNITDYSINSTEGNVDEEFTVDCSYNSNQNVTLTIVSINGTGGMYYIKSAAELQPEETESETTPQIDTDEISLNFSLNDGIWMAPYNEKDDVDIGCAFGCTPFKMIYKDGECIATLSYNTYEEYDGDLPSEDYYKAVYPNLRLSSICIWHDYTPVAHTDNTETATCTVTYKDPRDIENHPGAMADVKEITTYGILSYNKDRKLYVAIQFKKDSMSFDEITEIAKDFSIS